MSNIWSSSRDLFTYECPVCHQYIRGSSFEQHRLKEMEEERQKIIDKEWNPRSVKI